MALPTFKCSRCDKTFQPPHFNCETGEKHVVEPKIYFSPADSLRMYVTEDRTEKMESGQNRMILARSIEFVSGRYVTRDPEDQYALDQRTADGSLISEAQWKERHYKPEDILKDENKQLKERLAKYENDLLAKVKAEKEAKAGK